MKVICSNNNCESKTCVHRKPHKPIKYDWISKDNNKNTCTFMTCTKTSITGSNTYYCIPTLNDEQMNELNGIFDI